MSTENTPARVEPGTELERREAPVTRADTDSWTQVVGMTAKLAAEIAGTEFVPRDLRGKPAAVTAAILYGREIGLPPMTALTQTHVIEGRPAASAEAMRALVIAAGHEIAVLETTGAVCRMAGRRRGSSTWTEITWTLDMARAAGLLSAKKENWAKYPRAMLQARCSAELIRLVFPDVVLGMRATEELEDDRGELETPAETTVARDSSPAPAAPRKRAARKRAAAPPEPAPPEPDHMPLPGEAGYVDGQAETPPGDDAGADLPADQAQSDQPPAEDATSPESGTEPEETRDAAQLEAELDEDGAVEADVVDETERAHVVHVTRSTSSPTGERHVCEVCGQSGDEPLPMPCPGPPAEEERRPAPAVITRAQVRMINARLGGLSEAAGVKLEDTERRGLVRVLAGREEPIESTNQLTKTEGSAVIDTLTRIETLEELYGVVEATVAALRTEDPA